MKYFFKENLGMCKSFQNNSFQSNFESAGIFFIHINTYFIIHQVRENFLFLDFTSIKERLTKFVLPNTGGIISK